MQRRPSTHWSLITNVTAALTAFDYAPLRRTMLCTALAALCVLATAQVVSQYGQWAAITEFRQYHPSTFSSAPTSTATTSSPKARSKTLMLRFQYIAFWLATCARLGVQQSPGGALTPYDYLSDTPVTGDVPTGNFTYSAGPVQIYTLRTPMTVAWETTYAAVNLYVLFNGSVDGQTQLAVNLRAESYQWTVSCGKGDCSTPYFFRAVNSAGTDEELTIGGFTSRQFWIQPSDDESRSSSSRSTASTTTSAERSAPTTSVTSTTIAVRTTTTPTIQAVVSTPSSAAEAESTNTVAIGAGVGVGGGIAILAAGGLLFWLLRKRRIRKQQPTYSVADTKQLNSTSQVHQEKLPTYQVYPRQELYARPSPQEMPS